MGKSRRYNSKRYDETEEERQERLLEQVRMSGRSPTAPPGFFHDTGDRRKERKAERNRLKQYAHEDDDTDLDEPKVEDYREEWEEYLRSKYETQDYDEYFYEGEDNG